MMHEERNASSLVETLNVMISLTTFVFLVHCVCVLTVLGRASVV